MFDLDCVKFDVPCPRCRFTTQIFYRNARLRDVLICRGHKTKIQLHKSMNEFRAARRQFAAAIAELKQSMAGFSEAFQIKI